MRLSSWLTPHFCLIGWSIRKSTRGLWILHSSLLRTRKWQTTFIQQSQDWPVFGRITGRPFPKIVRSWLGLCTWVCFGQRGVHYAASNPGTSGAFCTRGGRALVLSTLLGRTSSLGHGGRDTQWKWPCSILIHYKRPTQYIHGFHAGNVISNSWTERIVALCIHRTCIAH